MKILFHYILIIILVSSITWSCKEKPIEDTSGDIIPNKYSNGFSISKIDEGYILKVNNRFSKDDKDSYNYLLSSSSGYESNNTVIIHIPVSKVVVMSTTHCAFISTLGKQSSIKGASGINHIYNDQIRAQINNKELVEIGYDAQINLERIISINPDLVFAYGIDNSGIAAFQKLTDVGIPVVFVGDFLETNALGRAEWIKFFACFYDKLDFATEYFDSIETNYNNIKNSVASRPDKPNVLVSLPWKGTWWVPGANSYFANLVKDAGGNYIFGNNQKSESIPLSIEEVFNKASHADIWLNPNDATEKRNILNIESRIKDFKPYSTAKIYNNNKRRNYYGGNDFWESGVVKPDVVLKDLIKIMQAEDDHESELYYYLKINW